MKKTALLVMVLLSTGCIDFLPDPDIQAAVKAGDPELCKEIPADETNRRDRCYKEVAVEIEDSEVCKRVIGQSQKDYCYMGIAEKTGDERLCEKVGDSYDSTCYMRLAVIKKDVLLCDKIDSKGVRDSCVIDVAVAKENPSLCNLTDDFYYQRCLNRVGAATGDTSLCAQIEKIDEKNACYSSIAVDQKDAGLCGEIEVSGQPGQRTYEDAARTKDLCYKNIGIETNDPDLCGKIDSSYDRAYCLQQIAAATTDESLCARIDDPSSTGMIRDSCYERVGIGKQDKSLCDRILDPAYKKSCLEHIDATTTTTRASGDGGLWMFDQLFGGFI